MSLITILASLTLASQIVLAILLAALAFKPTRTFVIDKLGAIAPHLSLAIGISAMLGSLALSDILGLEPCKLCWYQRVAIYPQVLLFGLALWWKDNTITRYTVPLSVTGLMISLYHYYLQFGGSALTPCSVGGYSVSCSNRSIIEFDYITIPMMSITAFAYLIVLGVIHHYRQRNYVLQKGE